MQTRLTHAKIYVWLKWIFSVLCECFLIQFKSEKGMSFVQIFLIATGISEVLSSGLLEVHFRLSVSVFLSRWFSFLVFGVLSVKTLIQRIEILD